MTSPTSPNDSRTVIRCGGSADFLAALPHVTGFTASDSVFLVGFAGSRSGTVVRTDLPPNEEPRETLALLDLASDLARDLSASHGSPRSTGDRHHEQRGLHGRRQSPVAASRPSTGAATAARRS